MNLFSGLFNGFLSNRDNRINYSDKRSIQEQKMDKALCGMTVEIGNSLYTINVPKRLYKKYKEVRNIEDKGKKLTALEKTYLYGYLNPRYHAATYPRKRVH